MIANGKIIVLLLIFVSTMLGSLNSFSQQPMLSRSREILANKKGLSFQVADSIFRDIQFKISNGELSVVEAVQLINIGSKSISKIDSLNLLKAKLFFLKALVEMVKNNETAFKENIGYALELVKANHLQFIDFNLNAANSALKQQWYIDCIERLRINENLLKQQNRIIFKSNPSNYINNANSFGYAFFKNKQYDSAIVYYQVALERAYYCADSTMIGICSGNIGAVLLLAGKLEQAVPLLEKDVYYSLKNNIYSSAIYALISLTKIDILNGRLPKAQKRLDSAKTFVPKIIENVPHQLENIQLYTKLYSSILLAANNNNKASVKELINFADSLENKIQSYQHTQRREALSRYEIEESLLKIVELENKAIKQKLIIGFIILVTIVVAFILGLQYRFSKKTLQQKALIEEQKKALEKLNADKSKYLSVIAHDLRTPLSSLRSVLEMYNDKMIDATELEEFTGKINKSLSAFTLTFDNLLLWAGMGMKGGLHLHIEKVSLSNLIHENLLALESEINKKKINFSYINNSHHAFVLADKQLLLVVLRNILMNAIKFTPQDKKMSLQVLTNETGENEFVKIIVMNEADNPLSSKVISFINDNEADTDYSSTKGTDGEKGSGLGLRVIKEFIQKMNGKIGIEKNEKENVAIYIQVPIYK